MKNNPYTCDDDPVEKFKFFLIGSGQNLKEKTARNKTIDVFQTISIFPSLI